MNVTELARILKITPNDLREKLPKLGFDIGQKAIKIDLVMAQRILREWPFLVRKLQQADFQNIDKEKVIAIEDAVPEKKIIKIPSLLAVRDFATLANLPINKVLAELMKNGVFASINERIDFDTAAIIGDSLNFDIQLDEKQNLDEEKETHNDKKVEENLNQENEGNLSIRPPVIVVMGHVDHGKTKLLDAIRKTDVVAGEAGGITQHIGAYQVVRKNRPITFVDTPGHEAFTAMRSRGAKIADVAILVVAADDGVQPQTIEAYKIIQAAGLPFIVAINKVDRPTADLNKAKQDLVNKLNILPEDWGGKAVCAPISALNGTGIDELLDLILLTADAEAKNMKANPNSDAIGTIIESRVDKNSGPISTLLVQNGTLRVGDQIILQGKIIGKARSLKNYKGEEIKEATPSTPVRILGIKIAPAVGDVVEVGEGERVKGGLEKLAARPILASAAREEAENDNAKKLNLIIKSDVLGSAEAIEESLMKLNTEEVMVKIVSKGLGNITEGDITRAEGSDAKLIGFNIRLSPQIETLLRERKVEAKTFTIIYDLIKYVKDEMQKIMPQNKERINLGRLKVLAIFRTENKSQVVGGKVLDGQIKNDCPVEVLRNKDLVAIGRVTKVQAGKMDVPTVEQDQECGIQYEGKPIIEVGDIVQFYEEKEITTKL
ncbi:MAG: translation initiation factor IF-2 [Patescibacteria group bacterium]|jgi:translation initiation factor IF-2